MSRERLSKLIHYLESNAKAIKPTFDMRHYGTCVIFHLPKVFPEDWEYINYAVDRAIPKGMTADTYSSWTIMDKAYESVGINNKLEDDFFAGDRTLDEQIAHMKAVRDKYFPEPSTQSA